ncbi:unnamed protein product [Choristocarpus tenellus]
MSQRLMDTETKKEASVSHLTSPPTSEVEAMMEKEVMKPLEGASSTDIGQPPSPSEVATGSASSGIGFVMGTGERGRTEEGALGGAQPVPVAKMNAQFSIPTEVVGGAGAETAGAASVMPEQKNRKRCFKCLKKVGYTGIACRCNYVFCALHRYPDQHDCTFDFKAADRTALKKVVVGGGQFSKVERL